MIATRRITLKAPTPRLIVFIATITIFIAILAWIGHAAPMAATEREAGGAMRADALQRARLLYQQLAPGEATPLLRVTYNPAVSPHQQRTTDVIVASVEAESTGRFVAIYTSGTGLLRRLTWAGLTPPRGPVIADERELLNHKRAVLVARRILRVAGVTAAGGPWTERCVQRVVTNTADGVRFVWTVQLIAPHWLFRVAVDSRTGAPTQLLLLQRNRAGVPPPASSRIGRDI
jgi:hypothetical protein